VAFDRLYRADRGAAIAQAAAPATQAVSSVRALGSTRKRRTVQHPKILSDGRERKVADDLEKRVQRSFEGTDALEEKLKNALLEIAHEINELRVHGGAQARDTSQSADMDVRGVDQSES
jgi:uncharacterized membrane protein YccC